MSEDVQLAGHAHAEDQLPAAIGNVAIGLAQTAELLVDRVQAALVAAIHEQPVQGDQEVVAGRPFHRPVRQRLLTPQDLLDDEVQRVIIGVTSGRTSRARDCRRRR